MENQKLPDPFPFLGRGKELEEIERLLRNPECRLLTLHGVGGIGKTRLARETARRLEQGYQNGACLVDLYPVDTPALVPSAIAEALPSFSLSSRQDLLTYLLAHLARLELLLVLDNFEHLLDGAELLVQLLNAAPGLKILVTSRETLKLREEWRYPVHGLAFPTQEQVENEQRDSLKQYGAVVLFAELAQRMQPSFSLDDHLIEVIHICQAVEGLPLALELAASWVRTLSCQAIAASLQRDLSLLHTRLRNVPQHQRSIHAVFNRSWQMMGETQQQIVQRLTVFTGGFTLDAARAVAGATLPDIDTLVDQSLVSLDPGGRYQIHALLAQFAAEQVVPEPAKRQEALQEKHAAYYCAFLQGRAPQMNGGDQLAAMQAVREEIENIRSAWDWAVQQSRWFYVQQAADALYLFYQFTGRYQEALQRFGQAVAALRKAAGDEAHERILAEILVHLGWLLVRVGQLEQAEVVLEESRTRYQRIPHPPPSTGMATDPRVPLGVLSVVRGDFSNAQALGEQVMATAQARGDQGNIMFAHYVLGSAARAFGRWEEARSHAEQSYALAKSNHNRWFMAYCLTDLGNILRAMNAFEQARSYYRQSYAIKQDFNDPEGIALALSGLGEVALREGQFAEAERHFEASLARYQEIGDLGGMATAEHGLGRALRGAEKFAAAEASFLHALQVARSARMIPLSVDILASMGELLVVCGKHDLGKQLARFVLGHPAGMQETKAWMMRFLPSGAESAGRAQARQDLERGLADLADQLQAEQGCLDAPQEQDFAPDSDQSELVEPLTPRELEVLHLLAEGLSNQEIATQLTVTSGTVKAHTHHIFQKLEARNRVEALRKAQALSLLRENPSD